MTCPALPPAPTTPPPNDVTIATRMHARPPSLSQHHRYSCVGVYKNGRVEVGRFAGAHRCAVLPMTATSPYIHGQWLR